MNIDAALRRYRKGLFADHDVTRCTSLSVRAWRELIKIGAVRTITEDGVADAFALVQRDHL